MFHFILMRLRKFSLKLAMGLFVPMFVYIYVCARRIGLTHYRLNHFVGTSIEFFFPTWFNNFWEGVVSRRCSSIYMCRIRCDDRFWAKKEMFYGGTLISVHFADEIVSKWYCTIVFFRKECYHHQWNWWSIFINCKSLGCFSYFVCCVVYCS